MNEEAINLEPKPWSNAQLVFLAKTQKNFVLWFAFGLILHLLSYKYRPAAFVGLAVLAIVVYDLARAVQAVQPGLYAFGSLIPIFSLLVLLSLNMSATAILAEHGIKVGLFGVKPETLKRLSTT
jgi:hypothetical protein